MAVTVINMIIFIVVCSVM